MDFNVKLINRRGSWLLLYIVSLALVVGGLVPLLNAYNAFLTAGFGVVILFGGGWFFWRIELAIQQSVRISILADELVILNQSTGIVETWPFDEIEAYCYFPIVKGVATLRLTLHSGKKIRLVARDAGFSSASTSQFDGMARAFEAAWQLNKA